MGPITSHAGSMLATLNMVTASKKNAGRSESLRAIRMHPNYCLAGGEAIDLPGAHGVPPAKDLQTLDGIADWLGRWLSELAKDADAPLVPVARSASAMLILRVNEQHPGLLAGVVLLSPMVPFDREHSNADLLQRVEASRCRLNSVAFDYMQRLTDEADWDEQEDPFRGLATLLLTGERDTQVSDRVRSRCQQWSERLPHVRFQNVRAAGHDVLNLRDREPGLVAYRSLFDFFASVR
ncbi:MAG: hypothetical protein AAGJ46_17520 [Planctomycetota bacterium]